MLVDDRLSVLHAQSWGALVLGLRGMKVVRLWAKRWLQLGPTTC